MNIIWRIKNIELSRITFGFPHEQQDDKQHQKKSNRRGSQLLFQKHLTGGDMDKLSDGSE